MSDVYCSQGLTDAIIYIKEKVKFIKESDLNGDELLSQIIDGELTGVLRGKSGYADFDIFEYDYCPAPDAKYIPAKDEHETGSWSKKCTLAISGVEQKAFESQKFFNKKSRIIGYSKDSFDQFISYINNTLKVIDIDKIKPIY